MEAGCCIHLNTHPNIKVASQNYTLFRRHPFEYTTKQTLNITNMHSGMHHIQIQSDTYAKSCFSTWFIISIQDQKYSQQWLIFKKKIHDLFLWMKSVFSSKVNKIDSSAVQLSCLMSKHIRLKRPSWFSWCVLMVSTSSDAWKNLRLVLWSLWDRIWDMELLQT